MQNALCFVMKKNEPGKTAGEPVFARYGVRSGVNVYLTANRPEEGSEAAAGTREENCKTWRKQTEQSGM